MVVVRRGTFSAEEAKELHKILLDAVGDELAENRKWRLRMYKHIGENPHFIRGGYDLPRNRYDLPV